MQAKDVNVQFGGVMALTDANLSAEPGQVTGLIGPNGAGKTTFFNVLSGLQKPTRGEVLFEDADISEVPAFKRGRLGMARTFQRIEVFGSLTVLENVLVAAEITKRWRPDAGDPLAESRTAVDRVGLRALIDQRVDAIPTGFARLCELARALVTQPKLVLLDEPGSGLDETESEQFGDLLLELARDGLGVLLVEHDVDLVMRVCDHIYVLEFGVMIADGTPEEIKKNKAVQAAYLGAEVA